MKILKKKWLWLIIILAIIVFAIIKFSGGGEVTYVTEIVKKQAIQQTVEVTGSVESADDIDLSFKTTGIVQEMLTMVGAEVMAGQRLASLRAGDIGAQIVDAQAAVDIAQSQLAELLAGASLEDVQVTEEELRAAEITYTTALDTLANLESTRDRELANLRATALNVINDKYFVAQYSLEIVYDAILDSTADSDLLTNNSQAFILAASDYDTANIHYNNFIDTINNLTEDSEQNEILDALDDLELLLEEVSDALSGSFQVILAAIPNGSYTATVIDAWESSINTQSTAINTAITAVRTAATNILTQDLYYQNQIIDTNNSIQSALNSLNLAQAKLNYKTADPRDFEIQSAEANVRRAQATLSRYLSQLGDTVITAPVDGIITKVNFDRGESTSLSTPVISMIGLTSLQIEVDVPESDITKLEVNDKVEITLDALNSDDIIIGAVTFIDPAATIINDVIYYKVKVNFNDDNNKIKSGMTADLTILTDSRDDVLVVPARAVIYKNGQKFVQILDNEQVIDQEIKTGLKGDDGFIEVIEGLVEGQAVITLKKNGN